VLLFLFISGDIFSASSRNQCNYSATTPGWGTGLKKLPGKQLLHFKLMQKGSITDQWSFPASHIINYYISIRVVWKNSLWVTVRNDWQKVWSDIL
jgi:hypothetical protein